MITKEQAMGFKVGQVLEHIHFKNKDGTPRRCRVTGQVKCFDSSRASFHIPVKYGLFNCFFIDTHNAGEWNVPETEKKIGVPGCEAGGGCVYCSKPKPVLDPADEGSHDSLNEPMSE